MKLISVAIAFLLSFSTLADTLVKSVAPHGKVQFEAIGRPSMLKIKGDGDGAIADLRVVDHKISGTIKFDLNALKTGIELRDEHMKDKYLQVKEGDNAIASMTFDNLPIPLSWSLKDPKISSWTFEATLRLHGVDRKITGTYAFGAKKLDASAKFDIKLSDYGIDIPQYLGIRVADVVNVTVTFPELTVVEGPAAPVPAAAPVKPAPKPAAPKK